MVNPTAGLANTIRGIYSTMYLSYFAKKNFYLYKWNSIKYYFNFPEELLLYNINCKYVKFNKFNMNIIKESRYENITLIITDIHGFMYILFNFFAESKELFILKNKYSIKKIKINILINIVYKELFSPSFIINKYINLFDKIKQNKKVLGIHIRSGVFFNNFTENYFYNFTRRNLFFNISLHIIKSRKIIYTYTISDNEKISNEMRSYYKNKSIYIYIKGDIIHSRFSLYKPYINYNSIRIISEFFLLSSCDVILGTKRSSFSSESCNRLSRKCFFV